MSKVLQHPPIRDAISVTIDHGSESILDTIQIVWDPTRRPALKTYGPTIGADGRCAYPGNPTRHGLRQAEQDIRPSKTTEHIESWKVRDSVYNIGGEAPIGNKAAIAIYYGRI